LDPRLRAKLSPHTWNIRLIGAKTKVSGVEAIMDTTEIDDRYCIGKFGDERLCRIGKLLYSRMVERSTVCLRQLSDTRATQRRFHRLLESPKVTQQEIARVGGERTALAAVGRHVLAIQDTSELDYTAHARRTHGLGGISSRKGRGLLIHPVLVVDAQSQACLGVVHEITWVRNIDAPPKRARRPIEEKESMRWLEGAQTAARRLREAASVTVVADRESDIYEEWDRIPDTRIHLLTRARHDRQLADGGTLFSWLQKQPAKGCYVFDVPARSAGKAYQSTDGARVGARTAHKAKMELRYGSVTINRPLGCAAQKAQITLSVVELRELPETVLTDEQPVHWILLTDHEVSDVEAALTVTGWYQQRWQIEQLFRILKRQGLDIEASQLEEADELLKLACLATQVAARTLQLVNARDGNTKQPASDAFDEEEVTVLGKLQEKLEGKTPRQKNPHPATSMAWASWIIARLGGWKAGAREAKPGPITMLHGLQRFESMVQGWQLAAMWA
jgi:hypothetical protein